MVAGLAGVVLVVGLALVIGCEPMASRVTDQPGTLTILFSADNLGVLSSCGCASSPSGGLAKRQTAIEDARRKHNATVLVDAGDMFNDRPNTVKVKYVCKAIEQSQYDAIAVGERELDLGVEQLRALQRQYHLPLVCSNVRDDKGAFLVQPHVIREVGGLKVGIFAVISDKPLSTPSKGGPAGLTFESPETAARREVNELKGCDVIIALSHQSVEATRALAAAVPGIQVVVSGHDEMVFKKPQEIGGSVVVGTGPVGRLLGILSWRRGDDGQPAFSQTLAGLSAKVDDTKWVMDLYWQYVKEAKDEPVPEWEFAAAPPAYEPAENCGKCHPDAFLQWTSSGHAHAYDTLVKAKRQDDPECILCHTMGYGRDGGFVSPEKTPGLGRVTCQACHPVTSTHGYIEAAGKVSIKPSKPMDSKVCLPCHGLIESPNFDFQVYKPKIMHPTPTSTAPRMPAPTATAK
jgi:hypothetical protein